MVDLDHVDTTPEDTAEFEAILAEEAAKPVGDAPRKEVPETPEPPPFTPRNEDETRALAEGWTPKEAWVAAGKDPDDWVSARRFNLDGKKLRQMRELEARIADTDQRTKAMLEHVRKTEKTRYEAQLKALEEKRWKALEEGDVPTARWAETQERELRAAPPPEVVAPPAPTGPDPLFVDWVELNPWYDPQANPTLVAEADRMGEELARSGMPYERILLQVSKRFANRAPTPAAPVAPRPSPAPVEAPRPVQRERTQKGPVFTDLSVSARQTFREFVRLGMYQDTPEERSEYARECSARGEG